MGLRRSEGLGPQRFSRVLVAAAALIVIAPAAAILRIPPWHATDALPADPDDPAIWVNRTVPARSLILGTVKAAAPDGGLAVFSLDGRLRQLLKGADRPNNVDVEYGLPLGGAPTDIAVLTERLGRRLRAYAISSGGELADRSGASLQHVLDGVDGNAGAPMGIGLYRRPRDGAIFAIVAPKGGPRSNYLWQYRLHDDGMGRVGATFVRRFGAFSGSKEIEAVAVDDALGYVYYADEDTGVHKWRADPDATGADRELAVFARAGYTGDCEGLGIYTRPDGTGYIVSVEQLAGDSVVHLYRREGEPGRPHDHSREVMRFASGADSTDGLDVVSAALGAEYPAGLLVSMNSRARNFLFYRWSDIASRLNASAASAPH